MLPDGMFLAEKARIIGFAAKIRVPAVYGNRDSPEAGGLERPTRFDLVINMKTAKALGLTIQPVLLLRADRLIE